MCEFQPPGDVAAGEIQKPGDVAADKTQPPSDVAAGEIQPPRDVAATAAVAATLGHASLAVSVNVVFTNRGHLIL